MEDVLKGELGKEVKYDVDLKDGKVLVNLVYEGKEAGVTLGASLSLDDLMSKLIDKVENALLKSLLGLVKGALKAL